MTRYTRAIIIGLGLLLATAGMSFAISADEKESTKAPVKETSVKRACDKDPKWKVTKPDLSQEPIEADNSFCLVCHANLEEEELVDIHIGVGVGCELCHGLSDDHSADEDSRTPPEIMWPKQRISGRCMTCHPREEMLVDKDAAESHRKVFARWENPNKTEPGKKYCTECHGKHRIRNRTRIWNKETGKLLKQSGGPTMDG